MIELTKIKGIGPQMLKKLEKVNINTVDDLVNYYPFRYNVFNLSSINEAIENQDITVTGIIESEPKVSYIKKNFNRMTFRFNTDSRIITVTIFNRAFMKNNLHVGRQVVVHGKYSFKTNTFIASEIKFGLFEQTIIEPVYHLVSGLGSKELNKIIRNALINDLNLTEYIPEYLKEKYKFLAKKIILEEIHNPKNAKNITLAKSQVIYEELFLFMLKISYLKNERVKTKGIKRQIDYQEVEKFINALPFELTKDQLTSVEEIYNDLCSDHKMNRLLLGDVGSGKTIVSFISIFINYLSGYQSSLMAPTELLATQHYFSFNKLFEKFNISCELLVGSMTKREKSKVLERIKNNEVDVIIGTHAILNEHVEFEKLGLVITDEQHRFGVNQRKDFHQKGMFPDILYMSATPIPRTYALTLYGDMDTSFIKTKPSGRKEITTVVKKESELKEVLHKILEEIKLGHQIYVVAPVIEESETDLHDVNELKDKFLVAFKNKIRVEVLHGKIKSSEKDAIMNDFKNGKIQILISTTVIEVGIDVKNATMMVIFNSERFGLATLHQLRGRVGRSEITSYCYLICNKDIKRLEVMEESNDGFYISQKDFEYRGEGDIFGTKQSGDMVFKMANLMRDYNILLKAKEDAEEYIKIVDKKTLESVLKISNIID